MLLTVLLLEATLATATAAPVDACIDGFEQGQSERDRGALLAARTHLLACAAEACPAAIRKECRKVLDDLAPRIPTLVFRARGRNGYPLPDVRVRIEGVRDPVATDADPLELDPGPRVLVWERDGRPVRREVVEIALGERGRVVTAVLSEAPETAPTPVPAAPAAPVPSTPEPRRLGPMPWVLGGLGVAGIGTFAALGWTVRSDLDDYERCAPACARSRVEETEARALAANVALGVGIVSLAAAAWWVWRGGRSDERSVSFLAAPHASGGAFAISGAF